MKSIKMSYKGFCFDANPETVKCEMSKKVSVVRIPFARGEVKETGEMPVTVSGRGKFCGKDAREKAQGLLAVFKRSGSAFLFLPVLSPVKAFFTELVFSVNAAEECIEYSFAFTEDKNAKKGLFDFGYTVAQSGENLFEIANRTDTRIESIIGLNDFEDPFSVREGDRVWLK